MRADVFVDIYRRNAWNGTETPSGPGSTMGATEALHTWLPKTVAELGCHAVLDAGCGTADWMPYLPGYVGVDVVLEAVHAARIGHPDRVYRCLDMCEDPLPACDLVICRDAMQHLSWSDALLALENFRRAGAQWIVTTTHVAAINRRITTGDWHPINVQTPPFNFGEPYSMVYDGMWDTGVWRADKHLGVWPL